MKKINKNDDVIRSYTPGMWVHGLPESITRVLRYKPDDPRRCLKVSNLHPRTTDRALWELFKHYGATACVRVVMNKRTGVSEGYAYACYEEVDPAILAYYHCGGAEVLGRNIHVEFEMSWHPHGEDTFVLPSVSDQEREHDDGFIRSKKKQRKPKTQNNFSGGRHQYFRRSRSRQRDTSEDKHKKKSKDKSHSRERKSSRSRSRRRHKSKEDRKDRSEHRSYSHDKKSDPSRSKDRSRSRSKDKRRHRSRDKSKHRSRDRSRRHDRSSSRRSTSRRNSRDKRRDRETTSLRKKIRSKRGSDSSSDSSNKVKKTPEKFIIRTPPETSSSDNTKSPTDKRDRSGGGVGQKVIEIVTL